MVLSAPPSLPLVNVRKSIIWRYNDSSQSVNRCITKWAKTVESNGCAKGKWFSFATLFWITSVSLPWVHVRKKRLDCTSLPRGKTLSVWRRKWSSHTVIASKVDITKLCWDPKPLNICNTVSYTRWDAKPLKYRGGWPASFEILMRLYQFGQG